MEKNFLYATESKCLNQQELLDYVNEYSDASATRRAELHISDCKLCSDAVEFLQVTDSQTFRAENKKILNKLSQKYDAPKVVLFVKYFRYTVAACLATVMIGFWFLNSNSTPKNEMVIQNNTKNTDTKTLDTTTQNFKSKIVAADKIKLKDFSKVNKKNKIPTPNSDNLVSQNSGYVATETINPIVTTATNTPVISGESSEIKVEKEEVKIVNVEKPIAIEEVVADKKMPLADAKIKDDKAPPTQYQSNQNTDYLNNSNLNSSFNSNSNTSPLPAPSNVQNNAAMGRKKSIFPSKPVAKAENTEVKSKEKKSKADPTQNFKSKDSEEKLLLTGIDFYNKRDFKSAQVIFDDLVAKSPDYEAAVFYKGANLIADNQCQQGIKILDSFVKTYNYTSVIYSEAAWLTANCLVKELQENTALPILQELSQYSNSHQDEAKLLLEKIKH